MNAIDPGPSAREGTVDMTHGSGGRAMAKLIRDLFHRHLGNAHLTAGSGQ